MRWTRMVSRDERCQTWTAKSCGPDIPTLISSFVALMSREAMVASKPGAPGRARISRNTIAQGMPVDPA